MRGPRSWQIVKRFAGHPDREPAIVRKALMGGKLFQVVLEPLAGFEPATC
jgi:hypothetical protein